MFVYGMTRQRLGAGQKVIPHVHVRHERAEKWHRIIHARYDKTEIQRFVYWGVAAVMKRRRKRTKKGHKQFSAEEKRGGGAAWWIPL